MQYQVAFAKLCKEIDQLNYEAASRAEALRKLPESQPARREVDEVLYYDDLYRKALQKRKFLQDNEMLPADEPTAGFRGKIEIPKAGLELADTIRNLAKNVSVWKKRVGETRYPDATERHAMYASLLKEAKANASAARAEHELKKNDDANNE